MFRKIQITGLVKENNKLVEYETGKHDSISSAEKDLLNMMDNTQSFGNIKDIKLVKAVYKVVKCYEDEFKDWKYA